MFLGELQSQSDHDMQTVMKGVPVDKELNTNGAVPSSAVKSELYAKIIVHLRHHM